MKELVEYLAKALVDDPEPVHVEETQEDGEFVYKLSVGQGDLGKIIGKKGRTAKAIRTLLGAAAAKQNLYASLDIVEPEDSQRGPKRNEKERSNGDASKSDDSSSNNESSAA